jgi:hypothetical protein
MGLPPEYWLGKKPHRDEAEIELWERSRVAAIADTPTNQRIIANADRGTPNLLPPK